MIKFLKVVVVLLLSLTCLFAQGLHFDIPAKKDNLNQTIGFNSLKDWSFIDKKVVYAYFGPDKGISIYKSEDGGNSWNIVNKSFAPYFEEDSKFFMLNDKIGFYVYVYSDNYRDYVLHILRTSDGCKTFNEVFKAQVGHSQYENNPIFHFSDKENGCIIYENFIFQTGDAGNNWQVETVEHIGISDNYLKYFDSKYGIMYLPWDDKILKTSDGGKKWEIAAILKDDFKHLYFFSPNIGWGTKEYDDNLYKTFDGGVTWVKLQQNSESLGFQYGSLEGVYFFNQNIGYLKYYKNMYKTTDGGATWVEIYKSVGGDINNYYFVNLNEIYLYYIEYNDNYQADKIIEAHSIDGGKNWIIKEIKIEKKCDEAVQIVLTPFYIVCYDGCGFVLIIPIKEDKEQVKVSENNCDKPNCEYKPATFTCCFYKKPVYLKSFQIGTKNKGNVNYFEIKYENEKCQILKCSVNVEFVQNKEDLNLPFKIELYPPPTRQYFQTPGDGPYNALYGARAWIDYNCDCNFQESDLFDGGEMVFSTDPCYIGKDVITGEIPIKKGKNKYRLRLVVLDRSGWCVHTKIPPKPFANEHEGLYIDVNLIEIKKKK